MIRSLVVFALAGGLACGAQTAPPPAATTSGAANAGSQQSVPVKPAVPPAQAPAAPDPAASLASTQPVITVDGVCSSTPARKAGAAPGAKPASTPCKTVITKEGFDKLLDAVNPTGQKVTPAMRRNLAQVYVDLLTFSQAAHKAGVDKDPNFNEFMQLIRMRTLKEFYQRKLEEKYKNPPETEVDAYYKQNLPKYEEIKLSRIFIPAKNPGSQNKDDWEKKAQQEASDIHDRAAKGEDFEKLQKEAYSTLGLTIAPPTTTVGTRRRGMLAANDEQELFALKPGEVSKMEQEPAGYVIYKVESKETLPVDKVKDDISRELFRQKMEGQQKSVTASVHADFNDTYFGPATPAPPAGAAIRPPMRPSGPAPAGRPGAPQVSQPAPPAPSGSTPASSGGQSPPK